MPSAPNTKRSRSGSVTRLPRASPSPSPKRGAKVQPSPSKAISPSPRTARKSSTPKSSKAKSRAATSYHTKVFKCDRYETVAGSLASLKLMKGVDIGVTPLSVTGSTSTTSSAHLGEEDIHYCTVAVKYCGLNFADMFACLGLYSATPEGTFVPGLEFSGVVVGTSAGAESQGYHLGDEVLGVTRFGGYTTTIHCDTRYMSHLPEGYNLQQGASLPAQALTAWYGLVELGRMRDSCAGLPRGSKTALIHSGAGGTGLWAIKLCQYFGVNVITTVGSASKKELLKTAVGLSDQCVLDRSELKTATHRRVALKSALNYLGKVSYDFVFDSLLGEWFECSYEFLGVQGKHLVLGAGSMTPHSDSANWLTLGYKYLRRPMLDPLAMISQNKSLIAFNLIWLYESTSEIRLYLARLLEVLPHMDPPGTESCGGAGYDKVGKVWPKFTDLPEALRDFQGGSTVGKVLVSTK